MAATVLQRCQTVNEAWSLTVRQERRLRASDSDEENTGDWRKLHNGELNDLYTATKIIQVMKSRR